MNCPKCDQEMERQEYDPSVGILAGGWFCQDCDQWIDEMDVDWSDDFRAALSKEKDLVGTCPKDFWEDWIAEGDAAGDPYTGEEWGWYTKDNLAQRATPGDRFYVVAHGKLRGFAPVTRIVRQNGCWVICRRGGAIAITIEESIRGFRGLRERWWDRSSEQPFPSWRETNG